MFKNKLEQYLTKLVEKSGNSSVSRVEENVISDIGKLSPNLNLPNPVNVYHNGSDKALMYSTFKHPDNTDFRFGFTIGFRDISFKEDTEPQKFKILKGEWEKGKMGIYLISDELSVRSDYSVPENVIARPLENSIFPNGYETIETGQLKLTQRNEFDMKTNNQLKHNDAKNFFIQFHLPYQVR